MAPVISPPAAALPALRRLPTPHTEPPFDDELARSPISGGSRVRVAADVRVGGAAVQGTLALAFVLPSGLPAAPAALRLRLVTGSSREEDPAAVANAHAGLPDPRAWAGRLVQAVVEVLAGERPIAQLLRWTDSGVYAQVSRRCAMSARGSTPPRPASAGTCDPPRAAVRSVRVMEPKDGVAEVCALVQRGVRTTAVALRLEAADGRWRCTALELG